MSFYIYSYDALGQLVEEKVDGVTVTAMTYDGYGNILSKNGKSYTYGDAAWRDLLTAYDGQTISYDAQGNPTSYLGHTLTWEKGRQLKSFDGNTYTYNASGIRTSKTVNGVTHTYTLDGTKILREEWTENGNTHTLIPLYDNEDSVCGITYDDRAYFFRKNLQGDVIAVVDITGGIAAHYVYDAWGNVSVLNHFESPIDHTPDEIGNINPFRYRGYYYDTEIAKYYLQSRYYDPITGRFVNGDEIAYIGIARTILSYNINAYCDNNVINLEDRMGCYAGALVLNASVTATMSGALPGIMSGISASLASIKAAIASSWFIPVCIAAAVIAVSGIIYVVNRVVALTVLVAQTISAVKEKAKAEGINPNNLRHYTVYVIVKKGTIDVVYVGITKNYSARKRQHTSPGKRFPTNKYTMMPIATGLTKEEARAMEQTIITAYTLDTLVNMINSISPKKWSTFESEFEQMSTLMQSWIDQE